MKSILQRPHHKYSDDPVKVADGTHLPVSPNKLQLDKALPNIPGTPAQGLQRSPTLKRVNFTPTTKSTFDLAAASPSPSKIPAPHFQRPTPSPAKPATEVAYPSLAKPGPLNSNPPQPSDFSFRAGKSIQFGPASSGLTSPTIRQVRPSGVATPLSAFDNLPAVPHGIANKKRRREMSEDEDVENRAPHDESADDGPRAKKMKGNGPVGAEKSAGASMAERRRTASKIAKPGNAREKGKGLLSLSRLNMLARPKERR